MLNQCWSIVYDGAKHWPNIGSMSCVCWAGISVNELSFSLFWARICVFYPLPSLSARLPVHVSSVFRILGSECWQDNLTSTSRSLFVLFCFILFCSVLLYAAVCAGSLNVLPRTLYGHLAILKIGSIDNYVLVLYNLLGTTFGLHCSESQKAVHISAHL